MLTSAKVVALSTKQFGTLTRAHVTLRLWQVYMNASHVIESLVDVVAKGGNLLLDIGPDEHGELPAPAVASMEEVGRWLGIHGEAIYDSGATRPHVCFP